MKKIIILMCVFIVVLSACKSMNHIQVYETHPPTAMEELKANPSGDFFQWDGDIYKTNIDWVDEVKVTKKNLLGKIIFTYSKGKMFKDGMATKLPVGAEIYSTNERGDILLVDSHGEIKKYLVLSEG